jgi:hypothetical protein
MAPIMLSICCCIIEKSGEGNMLPVYRMLHVFYSFLLAKLRARCAQKA